ncbi:MAG TPA: membrane protein insertase YidC [Dehalococcoidia bacterium]|nr:membrane protein insertase YidC [Dehalococcoidia bacterium]
MEFVVVLWNEVIIRPMLNTLLVFYVISFQHMGIAIILFTVLVRAATMPLTLKQIRQMRVMSTLQPKMKEIQARYSGDRSRASQETMRLYREAGVNPIGCLGPLVVQMPILIGLFRVLIQTLFSKPGDLIGLSEKLYTWIPVFPIYAVVPLNASFLGILDLAEPDPTRVIIPALVFVSTWVQQKLTVSPSTDPKQQSNQTMMLWMMPIMIAFFSLQFPSGLSMYWIVSNVIGVAVQYLVTPKGQLPPLFPLFPKPEAPPPSARSEEADPQKETRENGSTRNDGTNRRRSNRTSAQRARRRPRRGRGRNTK